MSEPEIELRATYRLQLTSSFGFAAARSLVPYLRDLGVSHLYLSPSLQARPGSGHGYDVIDPHRISSDLGGEPELRAMAGAARGAGMGVVLDVVPNHMAADDANRYWADPALRERFFDVDPVTGRHRRFFDIDDLAGLRQEDEEVFEQTHELLLKLVAEGLLDGLRIDHPDGLADPAGYLSRLRDRGAGRVWVEKILDSGERLRDWPVTGTVGYEFLNDVCALFVDPAGKAPLSTLWEEISGDTRSFGEIASEAKLEQARGSFAPEVERLARELGSGEAERTARELGSCEAEDLARALAVAVASLPVYRTYVDPRAGRVADEDRRAIAAAGMPAPFAEMLLRQRPARPEFVTRFQQTTPAVMAKGVEDTAFYRYARLLALNDVGGDPSRFGIGVEQFHAANIERVQRFPLNLLTTQTHDAKRSSDVRARIAALASIPDAWADHVRRWLEMTESLRSGGAPDDLERYFLFQTLAGAWPIGVERVEAYMEKVLREAKRNTNWIEPDPEWETAVRRFCRSLYADQAFREDFEPFVAGVARLGERIAIRSLVLKLTAPGVPDIYQGDELPYRALVDPDNRRAVDWKSRRRALAALLGGAAPDEQTRKLFVTQRLLALRALHPEPFLGGYEPIEAGQRACGFLRDGEVLVATALRAGHVDGEIEGPRGRWRDVLSGQERSFAGRQPLADLLDGDGVAIFERLGQ